MRCIPLFVLSILLFGCEANLTGADTGSESDSSLTDANDRPDADLPDADSTKDATPDGDASAPDMNVPDADAMVLTGSAGCRNDQSLSDGLHTFTSEGREREFVVRLPTGYSKDKEWPVIFALHGNSSNPDSDVLGAWDRDSGDRAVSAEVKDDAIFVATAAIDNQWRNYGKDRSEWPALIESELAYFDEIMSQLNNNLCVKESAVYSMGFSGGGSFSGLLACRREYIRAFAGGGAVIYFDEDNCVQSTPAWITIGDQELDGREPFRDYWRDTNGCDSSFDEGTPSTCRNYQNCDAGKETIYCSHPAGHTWPAFATEAMWDFLQQYD